MKNERREREGYLDNLRAVACISVITIHVLSNWYHSDVGTDTWIKAVIIQGLVMFCVPIFFMISGTLFLHKKKVENKTLFKKYIPKLFLFYILWSCVYVVFDNIFVDKKCSIVYNIKDMLSTLIYGNTKFHLWFVPPLIGLYLLIPVLKIIISNTTKKQMKYVILICFFCSIVSEFCLNFEMLKILSINTEKIRGGVATGYLIYFVLGVYLDKYDVSKLKLRLIYVCGFMCTLITIIGVIYDGLTQGVNVNRFWSYLSPTIFFSSIAVFLFFKEKNFSNKIFRIIAENSLGIYGCHVIVIFIIQKISYLNNINIFFLCVFIEVLITTILSVILSRVIKKVPFFGKYMT
ncbi:MAG: acyltransferase family protein [Clostridium sp.]|nr:acyltransferase family protein [Clostridium sp.]